MKEKIFNLFYFADNEVIHDVAIIAHEMDGTDTEKEQLLISSIKSDLTKAHREPLQKPITHAEFTAMHRIGQHLDIFDALLDSVDAPNEPFCCVTAIVDGKIRVDIKTTQAPLSAEIMQSLDPPKLNAIEDWLIKYRVEAGLDIPKLLYDDYFDAIKLLFNSKHYVSCTKLLLSFIDTISFLAYGDESSIFIRWLNSFTQLEKVGITSRELWEMRNAILHMSNLDSRKVIENLARRIGFCVAARGQCAAPEAGITFFNLLDLIDEIAKGISCWVGQMNSDHGTFLKFIERYDRILSDDRCVYKTSSNRSTDNCQASIISEPRQ